MKNSLSISNSDIIYRLLPDSISQKINQLGTINIYEIILPWIILAIILILSIYLLRKHKNSFLRFGVYTFLFYSLFRVLLFENPVAWIVYRHVLTWKEIGFREKTIIDQNLRRYITPPKKLKYLAIGSSQTGAIFSDYAHKYHNFYKIEYAGMGPLDYYLYTDLINKIHPKTLILFLSEFDFGRKIEKETMIFAPHQSLSKHYTLINMLKNKIGLSKALHLSTKMLLADLFPTYKYQFIFKGLRDKILNKNYLLKTQAQTFSKQSAKDKTTKQVNILLKILSQAPINLNFRIFNEFIIAIKKSHINLVIVEGQYHPNAYSEKNLKLKAIVSSKMQNLAKKYKFKYITTDKFPPLTPGDYADGYHPNKNGSEKIVNTLFFLLNNDLR